MTDTTEILRLANHRLKSGRIGVSIQLRNNRLYLRATLPPKPGSSHKKAHQQEISLSIYANAEGIKQAEAEAKKIGALLACREFSWEHYLKEQNVIQVIEEIKTIAELVKAFEEYYFSLRARNPKSETTWKGDYLKVYRTLPQGSPLTNEIIKKALLTTEPDTRTRKRFCMALGILAKFAGIELNFDPRTLSGSYSQKSVNPRELPSDEDIIYWFHHIYNPYWQWAYGMIATYGLRLHELFNLDLVAYRECKEPWGLQVLDGKTGPRLVYPYYPQWVKEFSLTDIRLPKITGKNNSDKGHRVTEFLFDAKIPFTGYSLRHCYSRRCFEAGFQPDFIAKMMGHSLDMTTTVYRAFWAEEVYKNVYLKQIDKTKPKEP